MLAAGFISLTLLIWFKTSAFVEYMRLFRMDWLFHIKAYLGMDTTLSYPEFLKEFYDSFITRLLSCPVCTGTWLGLLLSTVIGFASMPLTTFLGLWGYLLISKLL